MLIEVPIEKLKDRKLPVGLPFGYLGECIILGYTEGAIKVKVIRSAITSRINKIAYISKRHFFLSISEEVINDITAPLPIIALTYNVKLYPDV